jgi:ATP-binding cassette subfamily F protein 3
LLDEPTNHLDLEMRYALSRALQDFEGALVLVSHDRFLLRIVADDFWLVADRAVTRFDGDLDDYRSILGTRRGADAATERETSVAGSRKDQRRQEADKRRQLQPLRQRVIQAEAALDRLTHARQRIEAQLADPTVYEPAGKERLQCLLVEKAGLEREAVAAENAWLEASEALDAAQNLNAA